MELCEQILQQNESIDKLMQRIAEIEQDPASCKAGNVIAAETLQTLSEQLKTEKQELRRLRRTYDQQMLSSLVTNKPDTVESISWWVNRY